MKILPFKLCFVLSLLLSMNFMAQVEVTGMLVDDYTNAPIDGAKIKVKGMNAGAFTDENGAFKISFLGGLLFFICCKASYFNFV